jgi:hypothetical protein
MAEKFYKFSPSGQMDRRADLANEFYNIVFDLEDQPWFVSDEATLYDIYADEESILIEKCKKHYDVELQDEHWRWPLWTLLDFLAANRKK